MLDDFHHIEVQPIHDAFSYLVGHLPPKLHLVIASRSDSLLPLARLRARGELTELRALDLRFTFEESTAFLLLCSSKAIRKETVKVPTCLRRSTPDPGLGPMIELSGRDASRLLNLVGRGLALSGQGIATKEAPPALL